MISLLVFVCHIALLVHLCVMNTQTYTHSCACKQEERRIWLSITMCSVSDASCITITRLLLLHTVFVFLSGWWWMSCKWIYWKMMMFNGIECVLKRVGNMMSSMKLMHTNGILIKNYENQCLPANMQPKPIQTTQKTAFTHTQSYQLVSSRRLLRPNKAPKDLIRPLRAL